MEESFKDAGYNFRKKNKLLGISSIKIVEIPYFE